MKPFNVIGSGINYPSERTRAFTVLAVIALHCELSRGLVVIASELGKICFSILSRLTPSYKQGKCLK